MSLPRRVAAIALLTLLVVTLGYLFNRTQAIDIDAQNRVMLNLRELEKLDAGWNVNILRSHVGLNPDYDPLVAPLPRMHQLTTEVASALAMTRGPEALATYGQLVSALRQKEELVEQFKSQNAVLRNSLMYIPPAIAGLKTELTGIEAALVPARTVLALDAALNTLLTDLLRYNMVPDPALGTAIERQIVLVESLRSGFSPTMGAAIEAMAAHARAIVRYRELENRLERQIADTGTGELLGRLATQFDRAFGQVQIERQRWRGYLFAYSGMLLFLVVLFARRLRRSYLIINQVNRDLKRANETLELRVAERTAALEAKSEQLEKLAMYDMLTGLINYGQFTQLLDRAMLRAARRNTNVVVMFIDLDGFKAVNDTWGHAAGNVVLQEVARRVQDKLRKEDVLARLGGDEFVILLEEVRDREGARRVAELALEAICGIREAQGHPITISASIGISSANGQEGRARGAQALLADADQAMYQAKQDGKNGIAISGHARWSQRLADPVLDRIL
ncbi:DAHL domain-containing protein [Massilia sp. PAMC28688]|uniref:DAHL domain-containing protein n=1 Tax=Massilia sp. PAMC28688 TaxID=2861283 RepID=UPI002277363E|nr:DAHL domain-containing protein [Massilia sp. PAMC28688]